MKIALIGYGKMGKAIEQIAIERGHEIILKVNRSTSNWDNELHKADVAIEFTQPDAALENFNTILSKNIPLITGTTGWNNELYKVKKVVDDYDGSFLYASNFSIGVNLFFEINRLVAEIMNPHSEYTVEIDETHHTQKLDAPSGTAISIAQEIISSQQNDKGWYCPQSKENGAPNKEQDIKINAHRIENVPGTHLVSYISDIDTIQLVHEAKSRKGFALGAVVAAEFLINKKGVYTMKDVLNLQAK